MSTINEDLELIEKWMRQIQVDWEKFFAGIERKPPVDLKTRLEHLIRLHSGGELRGTERFRYQALVTRYATYNELWGK